MRGEHERSRARAHPHPPMRPHHDGEEHPEDSGVGVSNGDAVLAQL